MKIIRTGKDSISETISVDIMFGLKEIRREEHKSDILDELRCERDIKKTKPKDNIMNLHQNISQTKKTVNSFDQRTNEDKER